MKTQNSAKGLTWNVPAKIRFWRQVNKNGPIHPTLKTRCWEWLGALVSDGYGCIYIHNKRNGAHRFSWELHNGEIPDGLWVLHKCDNPKCVNPSHLFVGNRQQNVDDMMNKGRLEAPKGEKNGFSSLTPDQVLEIRTKFKRQSRKGQKGRAGNVSSNANELAKEYGISAHHVRALVRKIAWKHLEGT